MARPKGAQEYKTARIWAVTLRKLRLLAALTGESMVEALERIVEAELERAKALGGGNVSQGIRKALGMC